ncbi:MAG: metallophosphoesterase [Sphingomonadaceae bacterium]|nr:metallophosphoesterase [Sphingomonadaceae bacterium]
MFHVSDVHFGVEDQTAHDWFAQAVAREKPDAVICTGDITQRAKKREFAAARDWFCGLGVPVILEPGNHDMPYYNLVERFRTPFKRYDTLAGAVASQPDLPGIALVSMLTTVPAQRRFPWSDGVIREDALAQALAALAALSGDSRLKIVTCHHPLMAGPPGSSNPTIDGDGAFAALARAGADIVLSGHIHVPFDLTYEVEGHFLRMIGAGTLSTRLRTAPPGFNVITVDGQAVHVSAQSKPADEGTKKGPL